MKYNVLNFPKAHKASRSQPTLRRRKKKKEKKKDLPVRGKKSPRVPKWIETRGVKSLYWTFLLALSNINPWLLIAQLATCRPDRRNPEHHRRNCEPRHVAKRSFQPVTCTCRQLCDQQVGLMQYQRRLPSPHGQPADRLWSWGRGGGNSDIPLPMALILFRTRIAMRRSRKKATSASIQPTRTSRRLIEPTFRNRANPGTELSKDL